MGAIFFNGYNQLGFFAYKFFLWKKIFIFPFEDCIGDEVGGVRFIKLLGEVQEPE
jgi:hypothetical protein